MITPIKDHLIDALKSDVNSITSICDRLIRIARLQEALETLAQEAEAQKPTEYPLYSIKYSKGYSDSRLWLRADVIEEIHDMVAMFTHSKKAWGIDECGNDKVPYTVYIIDNSCGVLRQLKNLLGEPGNMISGMGNTDAAYVDKIISGVYNG